MELEEGKIYTTQQMQKFMGISKSTWDHRRDELLENFCLYYEYEVVYEGRSTKYHILRKLGDYQKPLSKRSKELRDQIYEKEIVDVIERDNVQTAKNIARIIQKKDEIKEYHHTEGTVYEYTRLRVASMFGKKVGEGGTHGEIIEKIWCRADLEHILGTDLFHGASIVSQNRQEVNELSDLLFGVSFVHIQSATVIGNLTQSRTHSILAS